jgi:outer membrane protein
LFEGLGDFGKQVKQAGSADTPGTDIPVPPVAALPTLKKCDSIANLMKGDSMSKRFSLVGILMMLAYLAASPVLAADVAKIGIVNFQKILEQSNAGKAAKAELKTARERMESDLKAKGAEIEDLRKRLENESMVMSKEMREEKNREVRIKMNDFKTLQKQYTTDLQGLERRLMQKMQTDVAGLVEEIGKKEGYLLIMSNLGVLYAPNSIDITDQIIKKLN